VGLPYGNIGPQIFQFALDGSQRALIARLLPALSIGNHALSLQELLMTRALIYQALAQISQKFWPSSPKDDRVMAVIRFIDEHFHEQLTNEDFADLTAMNSKAFVRLFKMHTGQTPLEYQVRKRLEHASLLLHHSNHSIEQIAETCGFCDRHHFSKIFKRAFNIGPATYRKSRLV
jgi:transcriptional regulator GlxA family with amidase domain